MEEKAVWVQSPWVGVFGDAFPSAETVSLAFIQTWPHLWKVFSWELVGPHEAVHSLKGCFITEPATRSSCEVPLGIFIEIQDKLL